MNDGVGHLRPAVTLRPVDSTTHHHLQRQGNQKCR